MTKEEQKTHTESDQTTFQDTDMGEQSAANLDHAGDDPGIESIDSIDSEDESSDLSSEEAEFKPTLTEAKSFDELNLHPKILQALKKLGWDHPTPIQSMSLPQTLNRRDVAGFAQTGTGKTGVFLLTIANHVLGLEQEKRIPRAIVLVPTRELAMQICSDAEDLFDKDLLKFLPVFGGVSYDQQTNALDSGVDVIVATPGRLKDYHKKKLVNLDECQILVCDEADRMLDMGFIDDAEYFLSRLGEDVQKLLFSATSNDHVKELAFEYLENPEYISINPESITPELIEQEFIICESYNKVKVLLSLLQSEQPNCSIIFTNTKLVADWLHYKLVKNHINADVITGDLPQKKRIALISKIKKGELKHLIATDVASRGLHIAGVTHVFNFDLPEEPANYIHRIGRTARAGAEGRSISLVCEDYGQNLEGIKQLFGEKQPPESRWYNEAFLQTEDIAGDPFSDPEFKGSAEYREAKFARSQTREQKSAGEERERGRTRRPNRDRTQAADQGSQQGDYDQSVSDAKAARRSERGSSSRGSTNRRRRSKNGRSDETHDSQTKRSESTQNGHEQGNRQRGRRHGGERQDHKKRASGSSHTDTTSKSTTPPQTDAPKSTGGLLKKLFKSFFGKKK